MSSSSIGREAEDHDQVVLKISESEITCPLSGRIFHTPVILLTENQENKELLDVGTTVEKEYYENWVTNYKNNVGTDPLTTLRVRSFAPDRRMLTLVNSYFANTYPDPEEQKKARLANQYQPVVVNKPAVVSEEKEREEKDPSVANVQPSAPVIPSSAPVSKKLAFNPELDLVVEQPTPNPPPAANPRILFPRAANAVINLPLAVGIMPGSYLVNQNSNACKGLLIGSSSSGKSAFMSAATKDDSGNQFISTIGLDFQLLTHQGIKYQLMDMAGLERFRTVTTSYYRVANFVLLFGNNFNELNTMINRVQEDVPGMEFYALNYNRNRGEIDARLVEFREANLSAPIQASQEEAHGVARIILSSLTVLMQYFENPASQRRNQNQNQHQHQHQH